MADEEVDWGMDEDVWRQGDGVPAGGANEDEISLDGMEAESEVQKPTTAKTVSSPQTATSSTRLPPTGPRRPPGRGDEPNSAGLPTGPKRNHPRNRGKHNQRMGSGPGSGPGGVNGIMPIGGMKMGGRVVDTTNNVGASSTSLPQAPSSQAVNLAAIETQPIASTPPDLEPLPEGWTEVISRTQKAVFYHNKLTGDTSWVRPRATPAVEEVVEDRPVTPPPTGAQTSFTGSKIVSGSSLPSKPAPNVLKQDRPPPTGPGGGKSDNGRGPVKSDDQASPAVDPVQSAYARRTAMAGRSDQRNTSAPVRMDERGTKRSPSPRREDAKRSRMDDPPRNNERFPLPSAPAGPRSFATEYRTESPARPSGDLDRSFSTNRKNIRTEDNTNSRPSPATQKSRGLPREPNSGSNTAPIPNNKWGVRREVEEPTPAPVSSLPPVPVAAALPPLPRSVSTNDSSSRRARILEEKRELEAKLRALHDEEDQLDREESERKRQEDAIIEAERKRREDDRLREDEDRRRRDETWRRENERRGSNERPRVAYSDQLGYDDRSYRPASPPRGPPPANRLDGPGPVPGLRDVRRARPDSPSRISRRPSPGPYIPSAPQRRSQSREHPSRYANRPPSPQRRNGDTYYPEGERSSERDRRPQPAAVSLAERIGSRPSPARPRSPPPMRNNDAFRREPVASASGPRPLAERMSRGVSGPRESWNGRDDVAAKRM